MEQAVVIVKTKKQRPDQLRSRRITKTAHYTISGPDLFNLHNRGPLAGRNDFKLETGWHQDFDGQKEDDDRLTKSDLTHFSENIVSATTFESSLKAMLPFRL